MKKNNRVIMLAFAIIMLVSMSVYASAGKAKYVLKLSDTNAENSYSGTCDKYLFDKITQYSGGKIIPQFYWSGSLGDKISNMNSIKAHTLEGAQIATTDLSTYDPGWSVFSLPFLFKDFDEAYKCYSAPDLYNYLDARAQKLGFKLLGFYVTGFRNPLNSKREVKSPADAKGIRLRVLQDKYLALAFKNMGFSAVSLGWSEVYTAMQQGTVDGAEQSAVYLLDQQLGQYGKYLTIINAVAICGIWVMDNDCYNKLPNNLKQAVNKAVSDTMKWQWPNFQAQENKALKTLKGKGVKVTTLTDAQRSVFINSISTIKDQMFKANPAAKEIYDKIQKTVRKKTGKKK
jgi:TRAP-type C4-dicarboxylate transport system substrate-binding protein